MSQDSPHVVILGAGFAGLWAARSLAGKPVRVTLIDRNNYHTFLPLLYQVGAAEIEPEQIAHPLRPLLRRHRNIRLVRASCTEILTSQSAVRCGGTLVRYDYLIIASGSTTEHFGVKGAALAFSLKSLDDAMVLRNHILTCFERAALVEDPDRRRKLLSFAIIGGGPTGVEYAGALAELVKGPLRKDFPSISRDEVTIRLIEASPRLLSAFSPKATDYARGRLQKLGVEVLTEAAVAAIDLEGLDLRDGRRVDAATVLWTAGVSGSVVDNDLGAAPGPGRRLRVDEMLRAQSHERVYVAGDLAHFERDGLALPMIAPVAVQQGKHAARNILRDVEGKELVPFRYRDKGLMATIGRTAAVTRVGRMESRGLTAWVLWLFVHILYLIGFRNRLMVLINWFWSYVFFDRAVRVIMPGCCECPTEQACKRRGPKPEQDAGRLRVID